MTLDKARLVEFLRERGQHEAARQIDEKLPAQIDTDHHGGFLAQHGVSPRELLDTFASGGVSHSF